MHIMLHTDSKHVLIPDCFEPFVVQQISYSFIQNISLHTSCQIF